jgi:hypothetical protein
MLESDLRDAGLLPQEYISATPAHPAVVT